jgi:murein L,D-transpeptidase YcbB/YkuD
MEKPFSVPPASFAKSPAGIVLAFSLFFGFVPFDGRAEAAPLSSRDTRAALRELVELPHATAATPTQAALETFYAQRSFKPVWSGSEAAAARTVRVHGALADASSQGLDARTYTAALARWQSSPPKTGRDAAAFDVALTSSLFRYASDLQTGRVKPKDVYRDVNLPTADLDPSKALADALAHDDIDGFLADLPPVHPGYKYLAGALARYRAIAAKGGWPAVPRGIALDGSDRRIAILAKRLALEDPVLAANAQPSPGEVRDALLRFEKRNGLTEDGKLGPGVLQVLNVSAASRVQQIRANMERWRWMPRYLELHYVEVDVPDQSVSYIDNGSARLYSKAVIGKPSTPTPILRTTVAAVIANPSWDIPSDIFARKLLPQLRRKPTYLLARNMVLADGPANDPHGTKIDWRHVSASKLRYQIQQTPGGDNALGTILFDMPNDFDVYLHDTPEKNLFTLDVREKSNGCVRVQEISALASLVLQDGDSDSADALDPAIQLGQTQRLALSRPITVYMLYWTAIAEADGTVHFRPDRYGRDKRLIAKL